LAGAAGRALRSCIDGESPNPMKRSGDGSRCQRPIRAPFPLFGEMTRGGDICSPLTKPVLLPVSPAFGPIGRRFGKSKQGNVANEILALLKTESYAENGAAEQFRLRSGDAARKSPRAARRPIGAGKVGDCTALTEVTLRRGYHRHHKKVPTLPGIPPSDVRQEAE
jgi:hypothetical protein